MGGAVFFALLLCLFCSGSVVGEFDPFFPPLKPTEYTCVIPTVDASIEADISLHILTTLVSDSDLSPLKLRYTTNYNSALQLVAQHPEYIIVGIPKLPEVEDSFVWVGPIYSLHPAVFVERRKDIQIQSPFDLSTYRVGTLEQDTAAHIALKRADVVQILDAQNYQDLFSLFSSQYCDVIVAEYFGAAEYLKENNTFDEYEVISFLPSVSYYYAFSKDTDPTRIVSYQNGLDSLKASSGLKNGNSTQYDELISKSSHPSLFHSSYYVLILSSYGESLLETAKVLNGIESVFNSDSFIRYSFDSLYLEHLPRASSTSDTEIDAYIALASEAVFMRFADAPPDAIITIGSLAYDEARRYMFSSDLEIPIISDIAAPEYRVGEEKTGVLRKYSVLETINLANRLHPSSDEFYVICGHERDDQLILEEIKEIASLEKGYSFSYAPYDISLEDLIQDINAHGSVIVLLIHYDFYSEIQSFYLTHDDVSQLTSKISAPVYTLTNAYSETSTGIVGGYEISLDRIGEILGVQTSLVLFGEQVRNIPTYIYHPFQPTIYAKSFERHSEIRDRLPDNTLIIPSPPQNVHLPTYIFSLITFALMSLLITAVILLFMQRKLAAAHGELIEHKEFLKSIIDSMPVAVAVVHPDTNECILMNEAMNQIIISCFPDSNNVDSEYAIFQEIKNHITLGGEAYEGEKECDTGVGKKIFQFYVHPIQNIDSSLQFVLLQIIDVTDVRVKEQEARVALDRFERFIEQNVAAILFLRPVYNEDGELVTAQYHMVNKAFCELMHLRIEYIEDVLEEKLQETFVNDDFLDVYRFLINEASIVQFRNFQVKNYDFVAAGFVFTAGNNPPYLCLHFTDEAEYYYHYRIEQYAIQKLEAVLTELAVLNDQIRNPLTVILCSLEFGIVQARADFETQIGIIDSVINQLDRRFLVNESLHAHICEKEQLRGSSIMAEQVSSGSFEIEYPTHPSPKEVSS